MPLRAIVLLGCLLLSPLGWAQDTQLTADLDQRIESLTAEIESTSNSNLPEAEKRELTDLQQSTQGQGRVHGGVKNG